MHMTDSCAIFGADKFYRLDLKSGVITEFLDRSDTSLTFAIYGAAHYDSFPIDVLRVANSNAPDEYLLCFHGQ